MIVKPNKIMKKAYDIAVASLRACYSDNGIYAGRKHFDDYWARDSFFASLGAMEINDFDIVKKNLEIFLEHTKKDGSVPLRIGTYHVSVKIMKHVLGLRLRIKPLEKINKHVDNIEKHVYKKINTRYNNDRNKNFPLDANALLLVSFYYYIKKSKDYSFATKHFSKLQKILARNFRRDKNYNLLLENVPGSSWDDSLNIKGESIYTNVCHCASIRSLYRIAKLIKHESYQRYQRLYHVVRERINKKLWNGEYYSNFTWNDKNVNIFSTAGNLLAIHWHVADKKKALSIEKKIAEYGINDYVPSMTNYPKYPRKFIYLPFFLTGTYDYHNMGMCWLWLGAEDVIVKYKIGQRKKAFDLLNKISGTITRHNGIYEVYEKSGNPVNRLLYVSEVPFAWSASLFIMAYHTLFDKKKSLITWKLDK